MNFTCMAEEFPMASTVSGQNTGRLSTRIAPPACRIALLGASAVDRVRASLVPEPGRVGYPVPTRFFTSETAAVAWLLEDVPSPA